MAADLAVHAAIELRVLTADDDSERGQAVQGEARTYLEPLNLKATYSLLPGRAAKVAAASLIDDPVDVMVLGMRGHSALHHLILGGTAEQLMRSVDLPVLLVP